MDNQTFERQIAFLIEIDKLKTVLRKTKLIYADRLENDAEHSWHLTMMALVLSEHANEKVNLLRVIQMLMVHDLVEIDAGDTFAYDEQGYGDKAEREQKAAHRLFGLLPDEQMRQLMELWTEFEAGETPEARFAGALDRLQPLLHNYHNEGDTWRKYSVTSKQVYKRNQVIDKGSNRLWNYARQIIDEAVEAGFLAKD